MRRRASSGNAIHMHLHFHLGSASGESEDSDNGSEDEEEGSVQSRMQSYLRNLTRPTPPPPRSASLLTPSTVLRTLASSTSGAMRHIMDPNSTSLTSTPSPTSIVASLVRYRPEQLAPSATSECCVCQESMRSSIRDFTVLNCGHVLHWACCVRWLRRDYRCPMCRATALPAIDVSSVVIADDEPVTADTQHTDHMASLTLPELLERARARNLDVSRCLERSDVEALLLASSS